MDVEGTFSDRPKRRSSPLSPEQRRAVPGSEATRSLNVLMAERWAIGLRRFRVDRPDFDETDRGGLSELSHVELMFLQLARLTVEPPTLAERLRQWIRNLFTWKPPDTTR